MSLIGRVEARCPKGCDPFEAETWTLVRGDTDEALRESALAGDLNLLSCPECGALFFPESTVIYFDPKAEMVAFVLPESCREREDEWRVKMRADFDAMKAALAKDMPLAVEPVVLFGLGALRDLLAADDDLGDEARVAEYLAPGLGLAMRRVGRAFARRAGLPAALPARLAKGERFSRERAIEGLKALLAANDRLSGYRRWLERLESDDSPVPLT